MRHAFHGANEGDAHLSTDENLRAVQLLLGHRKLESTVRYFGIEVNDALQISEQTET
jgi:site-specific recombinase XerC